MSLRFVGNQPLQSPPGLTPSGASTASLSIWVVVHPGSTVVDPAGVQLFGESGGGLSVGLSASGALQVDWSAGEPRPPGLPDWEQALLPGVAYHLAAVRRGDAREVYLNGLLVDSASRRGSAGSGRPRPFRLGPDSAGVDVTLGEPTLWLGHALTVEEVARIRDRAAAPGEVAPGSIALRWSLAGPAGTRAAAGDPGLAGGPAGGMPLAPASGSSPTYEAGEPAFALAGGAYQAVISPSGKVIFVVFRDEATRLVNVDTLSDQRPVQRLTLDAVPAGGAFTLGLGGRSTAPIPVVVGPPKASFTWRADVPPGAHDIAVHYPAGFANPSRVNYRVFDGPVEVGSVDRDFLSGAGNPPLFHDGTLLPSTNPVPWTPLGAFECSSGSLAVRVSAEAPPPGDFATVCLADALRIAPVGGGEALRVGPSSPPAAYAGEGGYHAYAPPHGYSRDAILDGSPGHYDFRGTGTSDIFSVDPGAVRAALEALPGIGRGDIEVTEDAPGAFRVAFVGAFGDDEVPLLVPSDPAVRAEHLVEGGSWPEFSRDGVPLPVGRPWWGQRTYDPNNPTAVANPRFFGPYCPFVAFPLFPDHEPLRRDGILTLGHGLSDRFAWQPAGVPGYASTVYASEGVVAGRSANWTYERVTAGRYRVSLTWPTLPDPGEGTADARLVAYDSTGAILATAHVDQRGAPAGDRDDGATWQPLFEVEFDGPDNLSLVLSNNAAGRLLADSVRLERVSADLGVRVEPGDVVTVSAKRGWATTVLGPVAAVDGLVAINNAGGALGPPVAGLRTMGVGWNLFREESNSGCRIYADVCASANWGARDLILGDRGLPARFRVPEAEEAGASIAHIDTWLILPCRNVRGRSVDGLGYAPGTFTLTYRAAPGTSMSLFNFAPQTCVAGPASTLPDGRVRIAYAVTPPPGEFGVSLGLRMATTDKNPDGSFNVGATDLSVCPPGLDPDALPLFHPHALAVTRSATSFRWLDVIRGIANDCVEFSDYQPADGRISKVQGGRVVRAPILSVEAHPFGEHPLYDPAYGPALRVTTSEPHQMVDGTIAGFSGEAPAVTLTNGNVHPLAGLPTNPVRRISDTVFTCQTEWDGSIVGNATVARPTGPGGVVEYAAGLATPVRDMVRFCNLAGDGDGADIFLNISITSSDACIAEMATYVATHLRPGRKVRVEYGNEPWNFGSPVFKYCFKQNWAYQLSGPGQDFIPYYVREMGRVQGIFKAAMEAAGRGGDCIRVLGGMFGYEQRTDAMFRSCLAQGVEVEELTLGTYWHNAPSFTANHGDQEHGPDHGAFIDGLDAEMDLDMWEAFSLWTYYDREVTRHRRQIDIAVADFLSRGGDPAAVAWVAACRFSSYEGGPEACVMTRRDRAPRRYAERAHAVHRHPRLRTAILPNLLRGSEVDGTVSFHFYLLAGKGDFDFDLRDGRFHQWMAYLNTTSQGPAVGAPGENADPQDLASVKSQVGGVVDAWNAGLATRLDRPTPRRPGRNGKLRAAGLPRGVARTTR